MRRAARTDGNQSWIVEGLRRAGATVQPLHAVGAGCPDLLVGFRGRNWLLEVKDPSKPKSDQVLTPDQVTWHGGWRGRAVVVKSLEDALKEISCRE
jgi:hypothetical protein